MYRSLIICLLSFPFTLASTFGKNATEHPKPSTMQTVLIFGDSLSAGYGLNVGEEWPALLSKDLGQTIQIINESISGETTAGGLLRFTDALQNNTPDILILELGANDGLRGLSIKTMKKNLSLMIEQAQAIGAQVILVGMHIPPNYGKRYTQSFHQAFVSLSEAYDVSFIPFLLNNIALKPELMQKDGLHPTAEAQPMIMNLVNKYLKPLLR